MAKGGEVVGGEGEGETGDVDDTEVGVEVDREEGATGNSFRRTNPRISSRRPLILSTCELTRLRRFRAVDNLSV